MNRLDTQKTLCCTMLSFFDSDAPSMSEFWRKCASCKKEISFHVAYWTCSVSTCQRGSTNFVFCSVDCWDAHVPVMGHREAWAEEKTSPAKESAIPVSSHNDSPKKIYSQPVMARQPTRTRETDILVVASKLKDYIRKTSGMNTSGGVLEILSDVLRRECDHAVQHAREEGRKTVMDRDFKKNH